MSLTLKQKLQALQYQSGFEYKGILETFDDMGEDYDSGKVTHEDFDVLFANIFLKRQIEVTLDEIQKVGVNKYGMFDSKIRISNEGILITNLINETSKREISLEVLKENVYKNIPNEWKQHLEYSSHEVKDTFSTDISRMLNILIKNKAQQSG